MNATCLRTALVALLALALHASASAHDEHDDGGNGPKLEDVPRLTVRGEAELERPADQVQMSIGVVTEGNEAGDALKENNRIMKDVVQAIEKAGLSKDDYETGQFRIRPQYSRRPRQPDPEWKPQIIGYQVVNSVTVKTQKLDLTGKVIQSANEAGANTVEVMGFSLADQRKYRAEAIREATQNAKADAEALADAAGVKLERIITINLDQAPMQPMAMHRAARAEADTGAPPIEPGDVTITANVTIVYEISSHAPEQEQPSTP